MPNKVVDYGWKHDFVVWVATLLNVPVMTEKDLAYQHKVGFERGIQIGITECKTRRNKKYQKAQQLRTLGKIEQAVRCEETAHQLKCVEVMLEYFSKL